MRRVLHLAALAAATSGFALPAKSRSAHEVPPPAAAVTALTVQRTSGRAEVVIGVSGDVDVQDFSLRAPHRIVVDLKGATLKMAQHAYDGVVRAGIRNIHFAQNTATVVRVVLDLDREREYKVARGNNDVRISLDAEDPFETWSTLPRNAAAPAADVPAPIVQKPVPPPAQKQAPAPVPVQVQVQQKNVEVTESPVEMAKPQQVPRITISLRDTELRDALAIFSERSGRSIITGITGLKITAEIVDQPWDVALKAILDAYGLTAVENTRTHVITVSTYQAVLASQAAEPLGIARVPLNFAKADTLAVTLRSLLSKDCGTSSMPVVGGGSGGGSGAGAGAASGAAAGAAGGGTGAGAGGSQAAGAPGGAGAAAGNGAAPAQTGVLANLICQPRGSVVPEPVTNTLIITEPASHLDSLVAFAHLFDVMPQQVSIKAQIISINRTNTNQLGVSYDLGSQQGFFNTLAPRLNAQGQPSTGEFQVSLGGDAFAGVANANRQFASSAAINILYSTMIGNSSLTSFIDALTEEKLTDIQSSPTINTLDKKEALVFAGSTERFLITPPTAAGAIQSQPPLLQSIDLGVTLKVTPFISANRMIRLNVYAEQSSLKSKDAAGPSASNRHVSNEIIVRDGETAYITGLEQTQTAKTRRGIPLLMSLPMIGRLFSQNESIEIKDDLLILVTPHILDDRVPPPPGCRH